VDDGTAQRSRVEKLTLGFDRRVTLAAGAAKLESLNSDGSGATDASSALALPTSADGGETWMITFKADSPFVQNRSLADGTYRLTIDPTKVTANGVAMSAAPAPVTFRRLFGDLNGDGAVNSLDYALAAGWSTTDDVSGAAYLSNIVTDAAGNVFATGFSGSFHGIVREKPAGSDLWQTVFDLGAGSELDSITVAGNGDVYVAGRSNSAGVVLRQAAGQKGFVVVDQFSDATTWDVAADSVGNIYAAGEVREADGRHWFVRRAQRDSATGQLGTFQTVDLTVNQTYGRGVTVVPSGPSAGVYTSGYADSSTGNVWLVRRSTDGGTTWSQVDSLNSGQPFDLASDAAGNIYVAGAASQTVGETSTSYWVVRKSATGANGTWSTDDSYVEATGTNGSRAFRLGLDPTTNTMYAVGELSQADGSTGAAVRAKAPGGTWQTVDEYQPAAGKNAAVYGFAADATGTLYACGGYTDAIGVHHLLVRSRAALVPPVLTSVVVGDGTAQRSQVKQLTLSFDRQVTLAAGAASLALLNTGGSGTNDGSAPTDASSALASPTSNDGGKTWIFTLATNSPFVQNKSLVDGIYKLTIDPTKVAANGVAMATAPQSFTFHRQFGDRNGDGTVNPLDYLGFRNAFGKTKDVDAGYIDYFDFNNDGTINPLDYAQFRSRFGKALSF
jgi:hypothetical protein